MDSCPKNYYGSVSGFLAEIDRMQLKCGNTSACIQQNSITDEATKVAEGVAGGVANGTVKGIKKGLGLGGEKKK